MSLHNKAEQYVLNNIQKGTWAVGTQIPTEMELTETLGISRPTLRQALSRLSDQGYLIRIKGKGTFVTEPKLLHESTSMLWSYGAESAKQGRILKTEVLFQEVLKPCEVVVERLKLSAHRKVTMLTRLRSLEGFNSGKPVLLTTVFVPYDRFNGMCEIDFTQNSFYSAMENAGVFVRYAERELEVAVPTDEIAELLQISRFEPVVKIISVGFLESGIPVEYSESWYPAECSKFSIRVNR